MLASVLLLGGPPAQAQTSEAHTWNSLAIGGGGFVSGLVIHPTAPGVLFARTDVGGAYRWEPTSGTWIPLLDWASEQEQGLFGVESMALDPNNASIVYAYCGTSYFNNGRTYLLRSTNSGQTFAKVEVTSQFKAHGNGSGRQSGEKLQVDPNNSAVLYCGTRDNGLFKSTDSGTTWARLAGLNVTTTLNGNGVSFVVLDGASGGNGGSQRVFAGISRPGSEQHLYQSTDGGTTFSALPNPGLAAGLMPQRAVLAAGNLYVTYANGAGPFGASYGSVQEPYNQGEVWKYNLAANGWTNCTPQGVSSPFCGISVDPTNPARVLISTVNVYGPQGTAYGDQIYLSTTAGAPASWTNVVARSFTLNANGVAWIPGQAIHWAGCVAFDPLNPLKVWVTSGNGVFANDNVNTSGTWRFEVKGLEELVPLNLISLPNGPLLSTVLDYDGFRHSDPTQFATRFAPAILSNSGLAYAALSPGKVVRIGHGYEDRRLFYSTDMGATWADSPGALVGQGGQLALSADGAVLLRSPEGYGETTSYRSTDWGASWSAVSGVALSGARPVADAANSDKFYFYDSNAGTMLVSTNGGVSFAPAGSPGTGGARLIRTVPGREGHLWVALYGGGLTRSTNSGSSFTRLPNVSFCGAIGLGKAAGGATYHTLFMWGTVGGVLGVHRSTDEGLTWVRVNDDAHEYGGPGNGQFVLGDLNTYGRVYMSTAGRGIVYANPTQALPVTLTAFDATCTAAGMLLTWHTATEVNNAGFAVQYSPDGQHYETLALVPGAGSSGQGHAYRLTVPTPAGRAYFRLRQLDQDGTASYSPVATQTCAAPEPGYLVLAPNPASGWVRVSGSGPVQLLDITGRVLRIGAAEAVGLDLSGIRSGLYLVRRGQRSARLQVE